MNKLIRINLIKNIIVLLLSVLSFPIISQSLYQIKNGQINDFLLIISMLLVTVCFANFAFTYEKSNSRTQEGLIFSHITTGWFMFLTTLLLECIFVVIRYIYPSLFILTFTLSVMLYIGVILYDFWDLLKVQQ